MPFVESYSVDFANGNKHPHLNSLNWPDLSLSHEADTFKDIAGINLKLISQSAGGGFNSVVLVPPGGIPLSVRLWMRVTFDRPFANPFPARKGLEPTPPEPWAVSLRVSPESQLLGNNTVNVTCQFHRGQGGISGVRLNTPAETPVTGQPHRGTLQRDQAAYLESPLNYNSYQGGLISLPSGTGPFVEVAPPLFTLEHSFCGWNFRDTGHTPGAGFLRINRETFPGAPWSAEVCDHRVYSNNILKFELSPETSAQDAIRGLGFSLGTRMGIGEMSVRLRSFQLWINESLSPV